MPPQEFTRRRNALAKELKERGDEDAAARISSLKRPTLALWAVNQLARRHPDTVAQLVEVQRALAGATEADELQEGSARRRRLVGKLTDRAREVLLEAELSASGQTIERIRSTLLAVNTPEEEELLQQGRLEHELEASGFADAFADLSLEDLPDTGPSKAEERAKEEAEELTSDARKARAEAEELAREAARLRSAAENADTNARAAERRAEELEKRAAAAKKKL